MPGVLIEVEGVVYEQRIHSFNLGTGTPKEVLGANPDRVAAYLVSYPSGGAWVSNDGGVSTNPHILVGGSAGALTVREDIFPGWAGRAWWAIPVSTGGTFIAVEIYRAG